MMLVLNDIRHVILSTLSRRSMCSSTTSARILDGRAIGGDIRAAVRQGVDALVATGAPPPGLAVVLVGERKDSSTYVRMKEKAAAEAGFYSVRSSFSLMHRKNVSSQTRNRFLPRPTGDDGATRAGCRV
eukprot:SAG11_NODE_1238_length_5425_cov_3.387908_9_plen_129_part_00